MTMTALQRRIEREDEAKRQEAWADRAAGAQRKRTKWAIDHLMDTGQITPDQHDAAQRFYAICVAANREPPLSGSSVVTPIQAAWDLSIAADVRRLERVWGTEEARSIRSAMFSWVEAAPRTNKARMGLMRRLFTVPVPSWTVIRIRDPLGMPDRVSSLLDVMHAFWLDRDSAFGRA